MYIYINVVYIYIDIYTQTAKLLELLELLELLQLPDFNCYIFLKKTDSGPTALYWNYWSYWSHWNYQISIIFSFLNTRPGAKGPYTRPGAKGLSLYVYIH